MKYDFSILITSYNQYSYIEQCINSLIHQSNVTYAIIISDDHSTDGTVDIIQKLISNISSIPITFIQHDVNIGMLKNMNAARGNTLPFAKETTIGRIT